MPSPRSKPTRGSALLLAMLLLTVLTVIGVAAVALSSQERQNASAKTRVDFLTACANAAQAKIWAEMAQYGLGYLGSTLQVSLQPLEGTSTGTRIAAPAHYDDFDAAATAKLVKDVVFKVESSGTTQNSMNERDCTNGACGMTPLGQSYGMTALCIDPSGREFEVELAVKFAL